MKNKESKKENILNLHGFWKLGESEPGFGTAGTRRRISCVEAMLNLRVIAKNNHQ